MMHSPVVAFPLFLQTHYIRNIVVVLKVSCFRLIFISSGKRHPLGSSFQENDPYIYTHRGALIYTYSLIQRTFVDSFVESAQNVTPEKSQGGYKA